MKSVRYQLVVPTELHEQIEAARGEKSRNRWILEAVAAVLGKKKVLPLLRGPGQPRKVNASEGE